MLLVEKTVISLLIETSANQDTKYNDNHRILEAFFDIWLVVSCKWIGQEKSLTFTEIIFMELLQCLQGTRSICWEKTGEAFCVFLRFLLFKCFFCWCPLLATI
ncbi:unnamed protein product [Brassica rapa]|uniref:Uncharacterized protein n=2 Tax=Brassica TaxID=3705 RepID=A0A8D9I5S6_BRACM|nr:unnamed protein product [Brassica napus]CAF2323208.1 unnamed protein product [Brassica napus]CAG7909754.1 unnamed protein product [Brassica rapa]